MPMFKMDHLQDKSGKNQRQTFESPPDGNYEFTIFSCKRHQGKRWKEGIETDYFTIGFKVVNHSQYSGKVHFENFTIPRQGVVVKEGDDVSFLWKLECLLLNTGVCTMTDGFDTDDNNFFYKNLPGKYLKFKLWTPKDREDGKSESNSGKPKQVIIRESWAPSDLNPIKVKAHSPKDFDEEEADNFLDDDDSIPM